MGLFSRNNRVSLSAGIVEMVARACNRASAQLEARHAELQRTEPRYAGELMAGIGLLTKLFVTFSASSTQDRERWDECDSQWGRDYGPLCDKIAFELTHLVYKNETLIRIQIDPMTGEAVTFVDSPVFPRPHQLQSFALP